MYENLRELLCILNLKLSFFTTVRVRPDGQKILLSMIFVIYKFWNTWNKKSLSLFLFFVFLNDQYFYLSFLLTIKSRNSRVYNKIVLYIVILRTWIPCHAYALVLFKTLCRLLSTWEEKFKMKISKTLKNASVVIACLYQRRKH